MTEIPVVVVNEFKVWKRELLLHQLRQLVKYGFGPMTYQNNKFINIPCHSPTGHLRVIASELCRDMLSLRLEVLLHPHLPV